MIILAAVLIIAVAYFVFAAKQEPEARKIAVRTKDAPRRQRRNNVVDD